MQENIFELIQKGEFTDPHKYLGLQEVDAQKKMVRLWRPGAEKCYIEVQGSALEAERVHESGIYECEVPYSTGETDYRIYHQSGVVAHDPYAFGKVLGDLDVHLAARGLHYELYNLLGATGKEQNGVQGTHFALWAPNACGVSLVGDFNHWDGRINPMRLIGLSGIWEIFLPGIGKGEKYKFEIHTKAGHRKIKADPVAHFSEVRPKTASIVYDVDSFPWSDADWLEERKKYSKQNHPINIYEVHVGSWQKDGENFLGYRELGKRLAKYCQKMGYTHVELMGVLEHPLDESWGYQVTGYFAPTSRYGSPEDFQFLVNELHRHHIGVILDWVPAHFPRDEHSLAQFDGTFLYEHKDPRQGYHPHWNTHIFNYGRSEVSNFLIASALFWLEKMHLDGLRVDAVASMLYLDYGREPGQWIPNQYGNNMNLEAIEFIKHMNSIVKQKIPDCLMIAEESTAFNGVTKPVEHGGLGFDLKWNMGWMNDTLRYFRRSFNDRKWNMGSLTFVLLYVFSEKFVFVLSHDEVVHGKQSLYSQMPGYPWEKYANMRLLLSFMMCLPGKKLLFMGSEMAQENEWDCKCELPWGLLHNEPNQKFHNMVGALNAFYLQRPALFEKEFEPDTLRYLVSDEENGIIIYLRRSASQTLMILHHMLPGHIRNYPLPGNGPFKEVFNTDREEWGGSDILNRKIEGNIVEIPSLSTLIFEVPG